MNSSINRKKQTRVTGMLHSYNSVRTYILTLCFSNMTAEDDIKDPEPVFVLEVSICLY